MDSYFASRLQEIKRGDIAPKKPRKRLPTMSDIDRSLSFMYKAKPEWLYFIMAEGSPPYIKIGIASNVRARMMKMQMDCPYRLRLLKRCPVPELERDFHERFKAHWTTGEWFAVSDDLMAAIEQMEGEAYLETSTMNDPKGMVRTYDLSQYIDHLFVESRIKRVRSQAVPQHAGDRDE